MEKEREEESDLISAVSDQDLGGPDPQKSSRASTAALKAGLVGFGLVLLSMLFLPRQDAVRWILFAAVGAGAALLLSPPGNIIRGIKTGAVAGLIAAGLAFGVWFALMVTVARPFLEPIAAELVGASGWSGLLSEFAWSAAWRVLAAVALGSLAGGIVSVLRSGNGAPRLPNATEEQD